MGDPATRYRGATENGSSFGGISGYSVGPGGEAAAPGGLWILQWINLRDLPTWRSVPGLTWSPFETLLESGRGPKTSLAALLLRRCLTR
jgi:hypothetical protein